jgi:hypothetical protein
MSKFKTIEFAGVAEDFCEYFMLVQAIDNAPTPEFVTRYYHLKNCTAPIVPNSPRVAELYNRARALGVKFIDHDSPFVQ